MRDVWQTSPSGPPRRPSTCTSAGCAASSATTAAQPTLITTIRGRGLRFETGRTRRRSEQLTAATVALRPVVPVARLRPRPHARRHRRRPARPDDGPARRRPGAAAAAARRGRGRLGRPGDPRPRWSATTATCDTLATVTDGCAVVTFDHEHVPTEHLHALADAGVAVRPGPGRAGARPGQGRDAASGSPSSACRARATRVVTDAADVAAFGVPVRAQDHPRRLRRQGRVGRPRGRRGAERLRRPPRRPASAAGRGAGRLPPGAVGPGRPLAERPGGGVPGRRVDPARRHLPRGDRPRARPRPRRWPARPSRSRCGSPASSTSPASSPSSSSRPPTGGSWSTSWRCARTTPATGPRTARSPRSSRTTCAPCSTCRSARPRRAPAGP